MTSGWIKSITLVLACALSPMLTHAADAKANLDQFNKQIQMAKGQFIQTVISPSGQIKQEGEGVFSFAKPGQFRWEIQKPFPQLIISDGKSVVTYDPDLEQASKRRAQDALESSPSALLFGYRELDKLFNIQADSAPVSGVNWLQATPIKKDSLYEKIRVGMRDGRPAEVEIYDSLGQVTRLSLFNWDISPTFEANYFKFVLPQGVDMIEVN